MATSLQTQTPTSGTLPTQFMLRLGSDSSTHVRAMARLLEELGARVELDPSGTLVAVRPVPSEA